MKKFRILALALTLVLCFGLIAGCVEDLPDVNAENGVIIESDDPASETIKVGLLGPDTGDVAQYGISVKNGVRLYIKELNAAGGINGKQVELINYDEEGDPQKAMTGYNALVDAGVTAIIGDVTTGPTNAVVPLAAEDNMPMITASATAASVTYDAETDTVYENMFRSCFIDPFSGEKMADFAYNELGVATAAVLNNVGDDYSAGCTEAFVAKAAELGLEIVALESYADGKVVDFQAQLTNIAAKNP
ncbi:MAG: ABC transporter substrate-binding protein, partial [Clostridiales bacterium]|nr:ABC transporter substrate-binding protein [Clostridiales bacterium]